jgi:tetratricopeptide (TPR) repeat protein
VTLALIALLALLVPAAPAQEQAEPRCAAPPADERVVDDYIAELRKRKPPRNRNPLPDSICIFGWCRGKQEEPPPPPSPPSKEAPQGSNEDYSSSRAESDVQPPCLLTPYDPIRAAEHTEIGDLYFSRENHRGALSRYQDALAHKPGDPALHLRLGRTLEKLARAAEARPHYQAALASPLDGAWKKEAAAALERLH